MENEEFRVRNKNEKMDLLITDLITATITLITIFVTEFNINPVDWFAINIFDFLSKRKTIL